MHATSTPTITQPRVGGRRALGAVLGLAAVIATGPVIGAVMAPQATDDPPAGLTERSVQAIQLPRSVPEDALTRAHRLISERQAARAAEAAAAADQMRYWNTYVLQRGVIAAPTYPGKIVDPIEAPEFRLLPLPPVVGSLPMTDSRLRSVLGDGVYDATFGAAADADGSAGGSPRGLLHR